MITPFDEIPVIEKAKNTGIKNKTDAPCSLIVWNDEVNTFDWVIKTLIEICGHSPEQAEQCAMLIHYKGKYAVQIGEFKILKNKCDAITNRMISATVESNA